MKITRTLKLALIGTLAVSTLAACQKRTAHHKANHPRVVRESKTAQKYAKSEQPVDIYRPSENKPYPKRLNAKTDRIVVSIKRQRAYLQHRGHTVYTMYASTGSHHRTPQGHFKIQPERTRFFYSDREREGASYGTSFHDHGVYLFHATPVAKDRKIIKPVARDLGKRPSSHGCVHLTIPDARYLFGHAPVGLPVVIK